MKEDSYIMGNRMTFPLRLMEMETDEIVCKNKYLYPVEVKEIQELVEDACDRMEYDGSLMYDEYPDKVSVESMVKKICGKCKCKHREEISNRWMNALVQMMLCNEMSYRRQRRDYHKQNLRKYED